MTARRHFGNVRKLPSGRYQASYWHEGERHVAADTFKTKADGLAWLAITEADLRRGAWIDPQAGQVKLKDYSAAWLAGRVGLARRTVELYGWLLDRYVLPTFGATPIASVTPSTVRTWYAQVAADHPSTAAKAYRLLSTILRTAAADNLIAKNPCQVKGAAVERAGERPTASVAEVAALADAMPERWRVAVLLAAWCQLRRGELLGLRRRDLDLLRGELRVEQTLQNLLDSSVVIGPPKTPAGLRTLAVPKHLVPALENHLTTFVGSDVDSLVLTGEKGAPLRPQHLQAAWNKARATIGRPDLHLHDLRHSGLTWSAATGATTAELMRRAGHASPVAAARYQHATDDRDRVLADALAALAEPAQVVRIRSSSKAARTSRSRT